MLRRLTRLELQGYKTFATKTDIAFGDVTCIVGPNGSGKSNIADGVRWVLGEQSYSLLRGRKTVDMIFSGSEQRSRASMASATIVFDNSDGWLPIDFSEVSLTRRAYRDGQNEYLLNGQKTRLRDVADLLGKVGLAQRTYTVIGQGLVDTALSLRADERRKLFEEAAGIGVYRQKREDALRKLEQTRHNLERVSDILAEIRPRLRALERQARRAREFHQLQEDLRHLLRSWYGYHWHAAQQLLTQARQQLEERESQLAQLWEQQQSRSEKAAARREKVAAKRAQLSSWHQDAAKLHGDYQSLHREIAVAEERARNIEQQRDRIQSEIISLEASLDDQLARLHQAEEKRTQLHGQRDAALARQVAIRERQQERESERAALKSDESQQRLQAAGIGEQLLTRRARQQALQERSHQLTLEI
ncbi:MAG: AAA family ATPase, partial [Anaerolineales bacterium]|nr:AAA family ATPase [Anaerolineales bacterium]